MVITGTYYISVLVTSLQIQRYTTSKFFKIKTVLSTVQNIKKLLENIFVPYSSSITPKYYTKLSKLSITVAIGQITFSLWVIHQVMSSFSYNIALLIITQYLLKS